MIFHSTTEEWEDLLEPRVIKLHSQTKIVAHSHAIIMVFWRNTNIEGTRRHKSVPTILTETVGSCYNVNSTDVFLSLDIILLSYLNWLSRRRTFSFYTTRHFFHCVRSTQHSLVNLVYKGQRRPPFWFFLRPPISFGGYIIYDSYSIPIVSLTRKIAAPGNKIVRPQ